MRGAGVGGDDHPARSGRQERRVQVGAAHGVEDDIEASSAGKPCDILLGLLLAVVDDLVRAERPGKHSLVRRGHGRGHAGSAGFGQLHGHVPDPARARMDQHELPGLDPGAVEERVPGSDGHQRQRRRLRHGQVRRFEGQEPRIGQHVFSQGAGHVRKSARAAEDLVAGLEVAYALAHDFDRPGHVHAQNCGQRRGEGRSHLPDLDVDGVHAGRGHAHQNMTGLDRGNVDIRQPKIGGIPVCLQELRFHAFLLGAC